MALKMSNSPTYQFGFTGFMGSSDSERVVVEFLLLLTLSGFLDIRHLFTVLTRRKKGETLMDLFTLNSYLGS
jgi:hypothetical protein